MIIQFCGLSGSGKTTLAYAVKPLLAHYSLQAEIIDGDIYRKKVSPELGFSKADRNTHIRRLAAIADRLANSNTISIISAINPYDDVRQEIVNTYADVKTVYINCSLDTLLKRDTKKLYSKAMLPDHHPEKIYNLTGINDPFDIPANPDLIINTNKETIETSSQKLVHFILSVSNLLIHCR